MEEPCGSAKTEATEAVPSIFLSPGLHKYVTPGNPGFLAKFKSIPEDFVVTEIDSYGQLVSLDSYDVPAGPPEVPPSPAKDGYSTSSGASRKRTRSPADSSNSSSSEQTRPDPQTVPPLQTLVTAEQYEAMAELARNYKDTLKYNPQQQIDLGAVSAKDMRTQLHMAVRLAFPVLETTTYRDKDDVACVCASRDSRYWQLCEVLSPDDAEKVLWFINTTNSPKASLELGPFSSREQRTQIHHKLSVMYGGYVLTKCSASMTAPCRLSYRERKAARLEAAEVKTSTPASSYVIIRVRRKYDRTQKPLAGGVATAEEVGPQFFTKFVLWKRNWETLEVLQKLGRVLECSPSWFNYCGNKDRKAVTLQEVTVKGISAERLCHAREELIPTGIDIGNFKYVRRHLTLGEHSGNRFQVVLRDVATRPGAAEDLESVVTSALNSVSTAGFINYFGLQRFSRNLNLPQIGLAMMKNDMRGAVNMALLKSTRLSDEAKDFVRLKQFEEALKVTHPSVARERLFLQKLHQYKGSDYGCTKALLAVPHPHRLINLHSLSSLLWNHLANYRLQEYGLQLVEGDLVMSKEVWERAETSQQSVRDWVHVLTAQDIAEKSYGLEDVVLPVMGYSIIYPHNKVADRVKELLAMIGITLASFRVPRLGLNCPGAYRKLMAYPKNLTWQLKQCPPLPAVTPSSPASPTVLTPSPPPPAPASTVAPTAEDHNVPKPSTKDDKSWSLELNFDLASSSYATMFIREITKNIY